MLAMPSGVVYGGAALALGAAATVYAARPGAQAEGGGGSGRGRRCDRLNAKAEAREKAEAERIAEARRQAEHDLLVGEILNQATGGDAPSAAWLAAAAAAAEAARRRLEWKEKILEPQEPNPIPTPPPPVAGSSFNMAAWKQQDYTVGETWERAVAAERYRHAEHDSPTQPPSEEIPWWQQPIRWLNDALVDFVVHPPPILSLSFAQQAPGAAVQSYVLDEWIRYQPRAGNFLDEISYQSVSVRGDISYKITSNPAGLADVNLANGRITLSGIPRADGSRTSFYVQPLTLSFGTVTTVPVDATSFPINMAWDAGSIVSVTAVDIDIIGRNWATVKVSQGQGSSFSSISHYDGGDFQRSVTDLAQVEMTVHRWPRIEVVVAAAVGAVTVGLEAAVVLAPAVPALQQLRIILGF